MSTVPPAGRLAALLAAALALAACAAPDAPADAEAAAPAVPARPAADTAFDAAAWMTRAAAVWDTAAWSADYDGTRAASRRAALELDAAVHWTDACDLPAEALADTTGEMGAMYRHELGADEWLVEVTCQFYAYQGTFALVHVAGDRAALVRTPAVGEDGVPADTADVLVGFVNVDPGERTYAVFSKSRGPGDCGTFVTYRVGDPPRGGAAGGALAEVAQVRMRACDDVIPDEIPEPATWPVVFPAP